MKNLLDSGFSLFTKGFFPSCSLIYGLYLFVFLCSTSILCFSPLVVFHIYSLFTSDICYFFLFFIFLILVITLKYEIYFYFLFKKLYSTMMYTNF